MERLALISSLLLAEGSSLALNWHPKTQESDDSSFRRRDFFGIGTAAFGMAFGTVPKGAFAVGEGEQRMILTQRPKAPLGALIPAVQQRLLLERCVLLASNLKPDEQEQNVHQLQSILVESSDNIPTKTKKGNKDLSVMLQYPPNKSLSGDIARAAMNIYTANLKYGEQPQYTVTDAAWKKSYVRANDSLPDVKQVIVADLDLRDLYRNQVQLKLDDAIAELYSSNRDTEELRNLLQDAAKTYDLWLGMISDTDVREALQAALEGKSLQIYDSYYAGFLPPR